MEKVAKVVEYSDINSFINLSEKELFKIYAVSRDKNIRNELIKRYLYIAEILSKKYMNRGIDYEDIFQVASLGLIYSIERFDISKGFEFSSFATPTIIGEIKKYFRDKGWAIRVPRRIQELSKRVNTAKILLNQKLQRTPRVEDIAEYLECTTEQVLEAMEAAQVYTPKSLDVIYDSNGDDKDMNLMDIVGEDDKYFEVIENRDFIQKNIEKLNEIEVKILKNRYFDNKTQIQVAEELAVSQMTISRIEKKIIEKFRKELFRIKNM